MSNNSSGSIQRFSLSERELQPGCRVVEILGELDLAVAAQLDEALTAAAADCDRLLVNLEGCDFIDSSGLAVLLRAHGRMAQEGRELAVYAPSDQVLRILSMTGLTRNGLVFGTAAEALASLDRAG
jgi:anti-sigma B factor antagonist